MAIYDILKELKDQRESETGVCSFNGYLEDYLGILEEDESSQDLLSVLQEIYEEDDSLRICVNLELNINKEAIANQIIRYKDSFKLPHGEIKCPYLIYGKSDDMQRGLILKAGDREAYILAKALYYVTSEPENEFEGTRNEIISMNMNQDNRELVRKTVQRFLMKKEKAGIVQRSLDRTVFNSYDEMYETAAQIGSHQMEHLSDLLKDAENKEHMINQMIATWFLLKKFSYVQYMMDKNTLNTIHEGNVKKQRQVAKEKCDAIAFVSYAELWKLSKEIENGSV